MHGRLGLGQGRRIPSEISALVMASPIFLDATPESMATSRFLGRLFSLLVEPLVGLTADWILHQLVG